MIVRKDVLLYLFALVTVVYGQYADADTAPATPTPSSTPATAATPSGNQSPAVCSQTTPPADASDTVKAIYGEIAKQCAQLQLRQVTGQLNNLSTSEISQALAGFSAIQGPSGKIVNSDKADHIGVWIAMRKAIELGAKIAAQINKSAAPDGSYVVVTDLSALDRRPTLISALTQLAALQDALDTQSDAAGAVLKNFPKQTEPRAGERVGIAAALALVPPAVNAFKDVASVFRVEDTLHALTLTGDPTWLIAGLGSCIDTKRKLSFVMPLFGNGANSFADTYTKARRSASAANEMLARMAVAEARAKADKNFPQDQLTAISSVKANLQAAVDAFVAYDKALNTVPSGSSKSPFDTFVETAALFGDPSAGYLVLQLPEVGASGGTRSRFIGSDKLEFQSTAVATYTLLNKEGAIVVSGATAGADATSMTTVDAEAKLAQMPSDLACSK